MALYAPGWLCDAAHEIMGGIDLDPCSCAVANHVVKARRYYTRAQDGLTKHWSGRLWLNPPFFGCQRWLQKLADEKGVSQAMIVVPIIGAGCELLYRHGLILMPDKRIKFWHESRPTSSPRTIVAYIGGRKKKFCRVMQDKGIILQRVFS